MIFYAFLTSLSLFEVRGFTEWPEFLSKVPLPRPDQVAERVVYVERTQIPHKAYWAY